MDNFSKLATPSKMEFYPLGGSGQGSIIYSLLAKSGLPSLL